MVTYHYIDSIVTFALMTATMISGAFLLMPKIKGRSKKYLIVIHAVLSIATYIALIITIIRAPRL